ncbi:MAG: hypothetical protein R3Y35_04795 [Clostridia bacterium]
MFWFKKKKKAVFGENIEPRCEYCRFNLKDNYEVACPYKKDDNVCKKYVYDPLKRSPMPKPKLKNYSPNDFSL